MPRFRYLHLLASLLMLAGTCVTAAGANFTVNSSTDTPDANPGDGICADASGNCTLRAAIQEANALPGADQVNLPAGLYILSAGQLSVNSDITLVGADQCSTTIDGNTLSRIFNVAGGVVFQVSEVTLTNGKVAPGHGGAIFNSGTLALTDCTVSSSEAEGSNGNLQSGGFGGALYNNGTATLQRVSLVGNSATGGRGQDGTTCGGGGGSGGGGGFGGAIFNESGSILFITLCTLAENLAEGGQGGKGFPHNGCNLNNGNGGNGGSLGGSGGLGISGGSQSGGNGSFGGGGGGGGSSWTVPGSGGNGGYGGGGGGTGARLAGLGGGTAGNGGFAGGNGAPGNWSAAGGSGGGAGLGGALFNNGGSVTILQSTIAFNSVVGGMPNSGGFTGPGQPGQGLGGGLFNRSGSIDISNTAVSDNMTSDVDPDVFGTITSAGGANLIGVVGSASITGNTSGNQTGTGYFYPPAGCPQICLPMYCSPVIDNANAGIVPGNDQLGNPPFNASDIGAIELQAPIPQVPFLGNDTNACVFPVLLQAPVWPYEYLWNTGATTASINSNTTGDYWLQLIDSLCVTTDSIAVSGGLSVTISSTNVSCAGTFGTAQVTPTTGTAPYTYSWGAGAGNQSSSTVTGLSVGTYTVTVTDNDGCNTSDSVIISGLSTMSVFMSLINVACNGDSSGQATVSIVGGASPFTYQWNAGAGSQTAATATGLPAGTYTVTVQDANSCSLDTAIGIAEPPPLSVSADSTDLDCFGSTNGVAMATASGGVVPYTFQWDAASGFQTNSSATGLPAGSYTVDVTDANGCMQTDSTQVLEPDSLNLSANVQPVTCFGVSNGSINVTSLGGTGSYTYVWGAGAGFQTTPLATGLAPGTYTVTVSDGNGCIQSEQYSCPPAVLIVLDPDSVPASCAGVADGEASVVAAGGQPPYSYTWNVPGGNTTAVATGLAAGTYSVAVTDSLGCTVMTNAQVTEPPTISVQLANTVVSCFGGSDGTATVSPSGGSAPYTYTWDANAASQAVATATGLAAGSYSVTVQDNNNCSFDTVAVVVEPPPLVVAVDSFNVSCNAGSDGAATAIVAGGAGLYTYTWNSAVGSQTTSTVTGLPAGSYSVTVVDAAGCSESGTSSINQPVSLAVSSSATDASCFGSSDGSATVVPTGGVGSYNFSWDANAASQSTATATGLAANTYAVTVTDANGCTIDTSVAISQPTLLQVSSASGSNATTCGGSDGTVSIGATGGTGSYAYSIDGGTTFVNNSGSFTGLTAGNYQTVVQDANGCTASGTTVAVNDPAPYLLSVAATSVFCFGGADGTATVSTQGGVAPYSYLWDANTGGQSSATATGLAVGTYSVTVTDALNCPQDTVVSVVEPAPFTVSLTMADVLCFGGSSGSATAAATGGTVPYTFNWSPNTGSQTSNIATGLSIGNYSATVTDAQGCTASGIGAISQPAVLTTSIGNTSVACNGASTGTASLSPTGGTQPYTYSWAPGGQTTVQATGLPAGTYAATVSDGNGCTTSASTIVTEPTALVLGTDSVPVSCTGEGDGKAIVLPSGGVPGYSYQWSGAANGTTTATAWWLDGGQYAVTVTDQNGCTETAVITVTEPAPVQILSVVAVGPTECQGNNGYVVVDVAGGTPSYDYTISTAATWNALAGDTIFGFASGVYGFGIRDSEQCSDWWGNITLDEPFAFAVGLGPDTTICEGEQLILDAGHAGSTYLWHDGSTAQVLVADTVGVYQVTVTDPNNCVAVDAIAVDVGMFFDATIVDTPRFCLNDEAVVLQSVDVGGHWTGNGIINPATGRFVPSIAGSGTHLIRHSFGGVCANSDSIWIEVAKPPYVNLGPDQTLPYGYPLTLVAGPGTNYVSIEWQDGWPDKTYEVTETGYYWVRVEGANGCFNQDTVYVKTVCEAQIYAPTAFTPDGDGINDVFRVEVVNGSSDFQFLIYNRYGELLWSTTDPAEGWDGTYHGNYVQDGVYVYRLIFDACVGRDDARRIDNHIGHVTLIR